MAADVTSIDLTSLLQVCPFRIHLSPRLHLQGFKSQPSCCHLFTYLIGKCRYTASCDLPALPFRPFQSLLPRNVSSPHCVRIISPSIWFIPYTAIFSSIRRTGRFLGYGHWEGSETVLNWSLGLGTPLGFIYTPFGRLSGMLRHGRRKVMHVFLLTALAERLQSSWSRAISLTEKSKHPPDRLQVNASLPRVAFTQSLGVSTVNLFRKSQEPGTCPVQVESDEGIRL
jgi:hypothetical protein